MDRQNVIPVSGHIYIHESYNRSENFGLSACETILLAFLC